LLLLCAFTPETASAETETQPQEPAMTRAGKIKAPQ